MKEYSQMNNDIAVSSRIRLARNLKDIPMPHIASKEIAAKTKEKILSSLNGFSSKKVVEIDEAPKELTNSLVEQHIISREFGTNPSSTLAIIDDMRSVMINEEDHVRLQVILPGFNIEDAYKMAKETDEILSRKLPFAFDEQFGYLTSCPTNLGTAMRASVMVHLPALVSSSRIASIIATCSKFSLTLRGLYGEDSKALGDLFQISNQNSLGLSENEIIRNVHLVTKGIIKSERAEREQLLKTRKLEISDGIYRAYGILSNARTVSVGEAMKMLSLIKMGVDLGIIEKVKPTAIEQLIVSIQPATLSMVLKKSPGEIASDEQRATYIRKMLKESEV